VEDKAAIGLTIMLQKQIEKIASSLKPEDLEATLSTLRKIFDNIIQHPSDDKYRQIKLASKKFSSKVWRYPACEELMRLSGWRVEDDIVRLRDESCIHIASHLIKSFHQDKTFSLPTGIVKIPHDKYKGLLSAIFDGNIAEIQKLLNHNNISSAGTIVLQNGQKINLLQAAIAIQQTDVVKLLIKSYSVDFYVVSATVVDMIFCAVSQSFAIEFLKCSGIRPSFKFESINNVTLLHLAAIYNCIDITYFLLTSCKDIDVNITDNFLRTPLHYTSLAKHTKIADYLLQHNADARATDYKNRTPLDYVDGNPKIMAVSCYAQNKRKIHENPFSAARQFYLELVNSGVEDEEAVAHTIEKFPSSLKKGGSANVHYDVDRASVLTKISKYISQKTPYVDRTPSLLIPVV